MKHLHFIFIIAICVIGFSCKEKPIEALEVIRTYTSMEVPARSLIDGVGFVKLETTADNLIGNISKILFTDSLIIIVDKDVSRTIQVFDKKGKYLHKIGNFGKGPTEYGLICDVTLSYDKSNIHILCYRRLLTYDLNGKFISSQKTKSTIHLIEYIDKNKFATFNYAGLFYTKEGSYLNLLEVVDTDFKNKIYSGVKSSFGPNDFAMAYQFPLVNVEGKVYILPDLSDTIYQITDEKVIPRYYIKTERPKPNSKEIINSAKKGELGMVEKFNGGFYHIGNIVIIPIMSASKPLYFYNTKSKKTYSYDGYKLIVSHPLLLFTNTLKTQYKSALVTVASPFDILSYKDQFYKSYDKKMIDSLLENMTEDDNPVLLFYHVNKNEPQ